MKKRTSYNAVRLAFAGATLLATLGVSKTLAQDIFTTGDLLVSSSTYSDTGPVASLQVGDTLPGGGTAVSDGTFGPQGVFTNSTPDASFGVTSPIAISQITTSGAAADLNNGSGSNVLNIDPSLYGVTSFPSKSELALNLSTDGTSITFMDYATTVGQLDVSNSNTPGIIEPGNPVTTTPTYRQVVQLNANGSISTTTTNAYSGNNGRAAILNSATGQYLTVGNAGNGNGSAAITAGTGVQIVTAGHNATSATPGTTMAGSFNITQVGYAADKSAKDNNYHGETVFNNTLYVTKGSGSNGINTVYQVGPTGSLPTGTGNTISILPGFSTTLAKSTSTAANPVYHPFGLFFANSTTLYVGDEGNLSATGLASNYGAGLQKWSLVGSTWQLDYTLTLGLNIGQYYTVDGPNGATYSAATDGLRNITGQVNADGTVSIYAVTSTIDTNGPPNQTNTNDEGADPNQLVAINDTLGDTTASQASGESFTTLESAGYGQVLRGVSFTPEAAPEPSTTSMLILTLLGGAAFAWKRRNSLRS
ncbi:MAG: hypothetical protein LV480_12500 [Methylacidiphilales bacterium]|nr:hypothetical protein [Candidatus Methylacidiphilales bacterium]